MAALREPSLGPVFGMKGGATAADTHKCSPWRISIYTSQATLPPSKKRITCWPP
jgi:hypothetical protein